MPPFVASPRAIAEIADDLTVVLPELVRSIDVMSNEQLNLRDLVVRAFEWRVARMRKEKFSDNDVVMSVLIEAENRLEEGIDAVMNNTLHSPVKK